MNRLFKTIKATEWWFVEGPAVLETCYAFMVGFVRLKDYIGIGYNKIILILENDYCWQVASEKETYNILKFIHQGFVKNPLFIKKEIKIWQKHKKDFLAQCRKVSATDLHKLDNKSLWSLYEQFQDSYIKEFTIPLFIEGTNFYTNPFLEEKFRGKTRSEVIKLQEAISILSQPVKKALLFRREKIDFLKLCLEFPKELQKNIRRRQRRLILDIKKAAPDFYKKIKRHSQKYFWIENNYKNTKVLDKKYFLSRILNELKQKSQKEIQNELKKLKKSFTDLKEKKRKIRKKIKLDPEINALTKLLEIMGWWQDERKEMNLFADHHLDILLKEIARRSKLSLREVQYLLPKEIKIFLLRKKLSSRNVLKSRRKLCIFITARKNKEILISGKKAQKIYDILKSQRFPKEKFLQGMVASKGKGEKKIQGNARVILDPTKHKLKQGEILITSMTRPEFVPLMKKAKAIITDEGGITSHAAVVSRELDLPCIIGTKLATKAFKNGDKIELNIEKGIIKKIK